MQVQNRHPDKWLQEELLLHLKQALTHSSYANEKKLGKLGCNERLEFLGDAVLELISSDFLYAKFTQVPEGELTKKRASLVCSNCSILSAFFSVIPYLGPEIAPAVWTSTVSSPWQRREYDGWT